MPMTAMAIIQMCKQFIYRAKMKYNGLSAVDAMSMHRLIHKWMAMKILAFKPSVHCCCNFCFFFAILSVHRDIAILIVHFIC